MIKKVLITGANGFIGSHLVDLLAKGGYQVHTLLRKTSDLSRLNKLKDEIGIHYIEDGLEKTIQDVMPDVVIHLATKYIKAHSSLNEVDEMVDSNLKFPIKLCENLTTNNIKHFISTGTCFEYKLSTTPLTEESPIEPYNFYAATKVAFSDMLKYYASKQILNVVDLKLFYPYGEMDNEKVVPFLIKSLLQGNKIEMSGGEQKLNFTYVKDVCLAYLRVLKQIDNLSGYNSFNIGSPEAYDLRQVAYELEKISGKELKVKWGAKPYPPNEIFYMNCDPRKARNILKWSPKHSLHQGLKNTYLYYQSQL